MHSIFHKLVGAYLLLTFALLSLIIFFSFRSIRASYIDSLSDNLQKIARSLGPQVSPLIADGRHDELDRLVKGLGRELDVRVTVIAPDGSVLADSENDPRTMDNHASRPEIVEALEHEIGQALRHSTTVHSDMLYLAVPLLTLQQRLGVLRVSLFLDDINTLLGRLQHRILLITAAVTLVSLLGALLFSNRLSRRIRRLAQAARRLGTGDFHVRIRLEGRDELRELADSFNYMTERMEQAFAEVTRRTDALNTIIASIQEGLMVINRDGNVVLCN